jgi:arylsulfatase A-like enzyme
MSGDPRPNILLITTDRQRSDTLGVYGNSWIRTPHLDALAQRGVVFRNAFTQNTVCIPSRACIQTGRYTHQHGVEYMESVIDDTPGLPAWELTFMERLQCAGYHTGAFGKIHMMPEKGFHEMQVTGGKGARWTKSAGLPIGLGPLGRDYAAWLEERQPGAYEVIYAQRRQPEYRQHKGAVANVLSLESYVDTWIAENTIEFVRRDHGKPFFVQCGLTGPHGPVAPPQPYADMYAPDEVILPANYGIDRDGDPRTTTEEEDRFARRWWAHYAGLVTLEDDLIGRIVAALQESNLIEHTMIIVTADHGEMGLERGQSGMSCLFEPVIHVPLIVVLPGGGSAHGEVEGPVETYDIAPTVLDYASAEIPETMSATSLRAAVGGAGSAKEMALTTYVTNDRSRRGICIRTDRYRLECWDHGDLERFFDLEIDPLERQNLVHDARYRAELARHRKLLIDRLIHTPA